MNIGTRLLLLLEAADASEAAPEATICCAGIVEVSGGVGGAVNTDFVAVTVVIDVDTGPSIVT